MLQKVFVSLLLWYCCSAPVSPAAVTLTDAEVQAIRLELRQMSAATKQLRDELNAQQTQSKILLETSAALETRLTLVLTKLEASGQRLSQSETELAALLPELAALRMAYTTLWESWTAQKNETRKWRRIALAGWISAVVVLGGGILWEVVR